jgi:hypothetical protein
MEGNGRSRLKPTADAVALYHLVYENEGFDAAAQHLFKLVKDAQDKWPGKKRLLFLDIEGHRNSEGGFDPDMLELQKDFVLGFLNQFLSEIHMPLVKAKNPDPQSDDIPERLIVQDEQE